jgi:hypothetical protein
MRSLASSCSLNASASTTPPPVPLQSLLQTYLFKVSQIFILGNAQHALPSNMRRGGRGGKAVLWVRLCRWLWDVGGGG